LGDDLKLKISDFDMAQKFDEKEQYGKGSPVYRAPELKDC